MALVARWQASFIRSPGAWILAALLAFSVYSHWQTGKEFTRVCETVVALRDGYFDVVEAQKMLATGIDTKAIMVHVDRVMRLRQEDSVEGRAFRWWEANASEIIHDCSNRLAEPEPEPD